MGTTLRVYSYRLRYSRGTKTSDEGRERGNLVFLPALPLRRSKSPQSGIRRKKRGASGHKRVRCFPPCNSSEAGFVNPHDNRMHWKKLVSSIPTFNSISLPHFGHVEEVAVSGAGDS